MIVQKYHFIARQLTIYGGIILFILCLFGTLMNIITFFRRTYHRRASSFYLLFASIFDLAHLTPGSISNILQYGFHYDWTINSIIYCKWKNYLIYVFTIISGTLTVFASMDRFLLSSDNSKRWSYSSRSIARRCVILIIIFWLTVSIPIIFCTKRYYRSSDDKQMICSNPSDNRLCFSVRVMYTCLFDGFVPPLIMMIFGLKTYNNMRHLSHRSKFRSLSARRINHQLTSMLVLQSIKSSFTSFPYSIFHTYWLITIKNKKSFLLEAKENLVRQILYLLFWSNYTSFFVYIYSSDVFRNQWIKAMKKMMCCLHKNGQQRYSYETELKRLKDTNNGQEQTVL
jgi:hypothetical protein